MNKRVRDNTYDGPVAPPLRVNTARAVNAAADTALDMARWLECAKRALDDAVAAMNAANAVMLDLFQQIKESPNAAAHVGLRSRLDIATAETGRLTDIAIACQREYDTLRDAAGRALATRPLPMEVALEPTATLSVISAHKLGLPDSRTHTDL